MKRNSGLQKRWLRNTLSILFAIVLLCVQRILPVLRKIRPEL